MKIASFFSVLMLFILITSSSCKKQEYFKSESGIRKELQGTWDLIAIPKFINNIERVENWVFSEKTVVITTNKNGSPETINASYSIKTSITKAEIVVEGVTDPLNEIYNGKWQIVTLDDGILAIANDHEGTTGLTQLEFIKR